MGCDIHAFVEVRLPGAGWTLVERLDIGRYYAFFAALAGVRGPGPEPHGIPLNASEAFHYHADWYGEDGHSHSWERGEDFLALFKKVENHEEAYWPFALREIVDEHPGETRVVFFFDN